MACPTCDHTMHSLFTNDTLLKFFWCPRCGTLKEQVGRDVRDRVPTLPGRVHCLIKRMQGNLAGLNIDTLSLAHTSGVIEGCCLPDQRKC